MSRDENRNQSVDLNIFIHVVPSSAEASIAAKLDKVIELLSGGASAGELQAATSRAQALAQKSKALETAAEGLEQP